MIAHILVDYRATKEAEAAFYAKQKEAEGIMVMAKAEAEGIVSKARAYGQMADVLGGPQGLLQYMMLQDNTYEKLANANARAINGLQPKISVWNTGAETATDSSAPIRNLFQSLPPLLSTIQDQTGMTPPSWLAQMPPQQPGQEVVRKGKTNGIPNGLVNGIGKGHELS